MVMNRMLERMADRIRPNEQQNYADALRTRLQAEQADRGEAPFTYGYQGGASASQPQPQAQPVPQTTGTPGGLPSSLPETGILGAYGKQFNEAHGPSVVQQNMNQPIVKKPVQNFNSTASANSGWQPGGWGQ